MEVFNYESKTYDKGFYVGCSWADYFPVWERGNPICAAVIFIKCDGFVGALWNGYGVRLSPCHSVVAHWRHSCGQSKQKKYYGNPGFFYGGGDCDFYPAYEPGKSHFSSDGYADAFVRDCGRVSAVRSGEHPCACQPGHFMAANSIINTVSSLASLAGPVLGGVLYSAYGLKPLLLVCAACLMLSAIMEIFITIPFQKRTLDESIWRMARLDFAESIRFVRWEKPALGKALLVVCGVNLFLSAMIIVALPYLITETLHLEASQANRLYGFAQGAMAAGGLAGGIGAGVFANKLKVYKAGGLLIVCAACVFPISAALLLFSSGMIHYLVLTVCCFFIMVCSTIFTVQMLAFIQTETPPHLIGKVIAVILTASMCAQPLGNACYGVLFELCRGFEYAVVLLSGVLSLIVALIAKRIFGKFSEEEKKQSGSVTDA